MKTNGMKTTWWVLGTETSETIAICMNKADADFICEAYTAKNGDKYIVRVAFTR